ncbi:hypothetical protein BD769DRAFT_1779164 [Suillus cothurnatus]|nr:hypothetical protein BD769DRAFT_1779164 [Suillus cothurnatus]
MRYTYNKVFVEELRCAFFWASFFILGRKWTSCRRPLLVSAGFALGPLSPPRAYLSDSSESNMIFRNTSNGNEASPSCPLPTLGLPSFSQVDKYVFDALPDDVRKELEVEYQRRSHSPMPAEQPYHDVRPKIMVKGVNVKRITQQLAQKNRTNLSRKNTLFAKRQVPSYIRVSDAELRKLAIGPDVFAALPLDLQREQVIMARHARSGNLQERKIIKASSCASSVPYRKKPPPQAKHPKPPFLKQQGKQPGEKLYRRCVDRHQVMGQGIHRILSEAKRHRLQRIFSAERRIGRYDTSLGKTIAVMK